MFFTFFYISLLNSWQFFFFCSIYMLLKRPCGVAFGHKKKKKLKNSFLFKIKLYLYNFIILFYLVLFYFILFALHCIISALQILCTAYFLHMQMHMHILCTALFCICRCICRFYSSLFFIDSSSSFVNKPLTR